VWRRREGSLQLNREVCHQLGDEGSQGSSGIHDCRCSTACASSGEAWCAMAVWNQKRARNDPNRQQRQKKKNSVTMTFCGSRFPKLPPSILSLSHSFLILVFFFFDCTSLPALPCFFFFSSWTRKKALEADSREGAILPSPLFEP
jgi:hypothetical protein